MTTQRLHPAIGDPKEFLRREVSFKKSCDFYRTHYGELLRAYADQWIAIHDGEVRGHAGDLDQLLAQVDALGVPRGNTLFEIVETNPTPRMLQFVLEGEFSGADGSPFIRARVWIPRFDVTGGVHFFLDTGTDYTTLMPRDASSMGIDHTQLDDELVLATAGGAASVFLEPALVQFTDLGASRAYTYRIMMAIAAPSAGIMRIPSLLGRDIINRWRIDYHPTAGALTCEVVIADEAVDLGAAQSKQSNMTK